MASDLIIIVTFLATTLAIGLYAGRGITTFSAYAVGSRSMSTFVLTASLIATVYGGGFLITRLNDHYHKGFYTLIRDFIFPIGFYLTARLLIVRMQCFMGHFSIAESMGMLYGQAVRIITALFGILMAISIVAIQFNVTLSISRILFPEIEHNAIAWATILSLIVVVYASFGGAKAVTVTDVYQFLLLFVCCPVIIFTLLYHTCYPWDACRKLIQIPKFNPIKVFTWHNILQTLKTYAALVLFPITPALMQRMYMSSSVQQATKVFFNTAVIRIIFSLLACTVAIMLHIGGHILPASQYLLDYIISLDYLPGIKGLLVSTIIALVMSTADSDLHIASVLCTNDLFPALFRRSAVFRTPSLKTARITAGAIGILSLMIALYTTSILQLFNQSTLFYASVITVPFILPSIGFRPHTAAVLYTMAISTTLVGYTIFVKQQVIKQSDILTYVLISLLTLFIIHYYFLPKQPGRGWVGILDDSPVQLQNQETKRWWLIKFKQLQSIFTQSYWASIFPQMPTHFIALGIYLIIYSFVSLLYMQKSYLFPYIYYHIAIMVIGTLMTCYPYLHSYKKGGNRLLHALWPMLLYIILFVSAITFAKLSHFSPIVCGLIMVNSALSSLLLPLPIAITMLAIAFFTDQWMMPGLPIGSIWFYANKNGSSLEWIVAVAIGCSSLVSCLTYRHARRKIQLKYKIMQLARNYEQEIVLASIHNQANWNRFDPTYSGKMLQEIADAIQPDAKSIEVQRQKLYAFSRILLQRAKEERMLTLDPKSLQQVDVDAMVFKAYETVRNLDKPLQLLLKKQTKATHILTDPAFFERLITINFLKICQSKQATNHIITLTIADTLLTYRSHKESPLATNTNSIHHKQPIPPVLSALAFCISTDTASPDLQATYDMTDQGTAAYLPKETDNLYQVESKQILQAHGGYTETIETEASLTCLYVIPLNGKKVMHLKRYQMEDLFQEVSKTTGSIAQEKALVGLLVKETALEKEKIEQAIAFIKQAHGMTMRKSGDPYYTHPMAVTKIVLEVTKDPVTLLAALLHDVVEDTAVTLEQIELIYGSEIAYILDMVTHYNTQGYRWKLDPSETHLLLYQCNDIRVVQIKLADRLHNLRTLSVRKPVNQLRVAKETFGFYIPWAKKNNILNWIAEMEAICQKVFSSCSRSV